MSKKIVGRRRGNRSDRRRGRVKVITILVDTQPKIRLGQVSDLINQINDFLERPPVDRLN